MIISSLLQGIEELLGDSRASTVMLMLCRLREYGSGCTEPMNTNMRGDATRGNQISTRDKINHGYRPQGQGHKAPGLREADSGSFVGNNINNHTIGHVLLCMCVLINKSVSDRRKIDRSSQTHHIVCQVMNPTFTSRTSTKYVRTRLIC